MRNKNVSSGVKEYSKITPKPDITPPPHPVKNVIVVIKTNKRTSKKRGAIS